MSGSKGVRCSRLIACCKLIAAVRTR